MSITFAVSDVEVSPKRLAPVVGLPRLQSMFPGTRLEQSAFDAPLALHDDVNAFVSTAWAAFDRHLPLRLSPDAVWFTVAQGLARAVSLDPEGLRPRLVQHAGTLRLEVRRDDFTLGEINPWGDVFAAFSDEVAAHVGRLRDLVRGEFSTTGAMQRAAFDVLVMDVFQHYFEYEFMCGCGIPSVTLLGTPDDWRGVRGRAEVLAEFDLAWWVETLLPILDEFVAAAEGSPRVDFWRSMVRYRSGSMGSELTGWIHTLVPFLYDRHHALVRNPHLASWRDRYDLLESDAGRRVRRQGPSLEAVPPSLASAPLWFSPAGQPRLRGRFVAGLFGARQHDDDGALEATFGWAVLLDAWSPPRWPSTERPIVRPHAPWTDRASHAARLEDPWSRWHATVEAAVSELVDALPVPSCTPDEARWFWWAYGVDADVAPCAEADTARVRRAVDAVTQALEALGEGADRALSEAPGCVAVALVLVEPDRFAPRMRIGSAETLHALVLAGRADEAWARHDWSTPLPTEARRDESLLDDLLSGASTSVHAALAMSLAEVAVARGDDASAVRVLRAWTRSSRDASLAEPGTALAAVRALRTLAARGHGADVAAFCDAWRAGGGHHPVFAGLRDEIATKGCDDDPSRVTT